MAATKSQGGRRVEPLNGGLITGEDPALLRPGQLSGLRNLVYRNGGSALERATGRQSFGAASAAATGVPGLRDFQFDNGDHYLVAQVGSLYRIATVAATGTFSDLATVTAGDSLEVVQYRNRFFLLNGASANATAIGTNQVVYLSATATGTAPTVRQHGMSPVRAAPNVTTGSGSFSQSVTGYYEYWTTEVAKFTQDGVDQSIESAFSSDNGVTTILVSSTTVQPTVQMPVLENSITTHWRIYRSPKKDAATDKEFPTGYMIAELATSVSSHADSGSATQASSFPASANASPGDVYGTDFASASSAFADDGVYASATIAAHGFAGIKRQAYYAFSLPNVKGNVNGIVVEVQGYVSGGTGPAQVNARIGKRSPGGVFLYNKYATKSGQLTSTSSASPTTLSLGSSTDRWWPANDPDGLVDSNFSGGEVMVALETSIGGWSSTASVGIDYVKLTVHYGSSTDSVVVYPTVVYTFGDVSSQVSKNFPPPSADTGDVYQDSLVLNDVLAPAVIRYSFPGEPEAFPPSYYIDFETRANDQVRCIRVVNGRLVVGLDTSVWRVNYLPSERDASFDRGKAKDPIAGDVGIVNAMCAATFTIDGQTEQLAFVSHKGIHSTDGFNFITRTKHQDWRRFISLDATSTPIALLNDPEHRCLRFYFRCDATEYGNETYLCLYLSYDPGDIDAEGNFKVSGPVHMRNYDSGGGGFASLDSVWAVPLSDGDTGFFMGYGGTSAAAGAGSIYYETGTAMPAQDPEGQYTTRRMYQAGLTGEWMLDDLYGYCGSYEGSPLLTYTFKGSKTNDSGEATLGTKTITLGGQVLHKVTPRIMSEGLRIQMKTSGAGEFRQELLVVGSTDFGIEDAGT